MPQSTEIWYHNKEKKTFRKVVIPVEEAQRAAEESQEVLKQGYSSVEFTLHEKDGSQNTYDDATAEIVPDSEHTLYCRN